MTERPSRNNRLIDAMRKTWTTNSELAWNLSISETRISRIRCNRVRPTETEKTKVAQYLGVNTNDIFFKGGL